MIIVYRRTKNINPQSVPQTCMHWRILFKCHIHSQQQLNRTFVKELILQKSIASFSSLYMPSISTNDYQRVTEEIPPKLDVS